MCPPPYTIIALYTRLPTSSPTTHHPHSLATHLDSARAISSGEEILFTYGDLSDTELLHTYGFVEGLDVPRSQGQACVQLADVLTGCGGARAQRGASGSDRCACEAIRAYLAPADAFQVSVAGSIPPTGLLFAVQARERVVQGRGWLAKSCMPGQSHVLVWHRGTQALLSERGSSHLSNS